MQQGRTTRQTEDPNHRHTNKSFTERKHGFFNLPRDKVMTPNKELGRRQIWIRRGSARQPKTIECSLQSDAAIAVLCIRRNRTPLLGSLFGLGNLVDAKRFSAWRHPVFDSWED